MGDYAVFKRGFINAKGRNIKKWKKVWAKLQDGTFSYYNDSESPGDLIETIQLSEGVRVALGDKKETKSDFSLRLFHPINKSWVPLFLAADSEQEMNDWLKAISLGVDLNTTNVFGVDLTIILKKYGRPVPPVVEKCLLSLRSAIQVSGIFRISGTQTDVLSYKAQFDRGEEVDFSYCKDPHVISNVLKLYLRELPNPLMTAEMYPKFIEAHTGSQDQILEKIRTLIWNLPVSHRNTLHYLIQFLNVVSQSSSVNMMTTLNLATVFGPTILKPGKEESMLDAAKMEIANAITDKIIQYYDYIFGQNMIPGLQFAVGSSGAPAQTVQPTPVQQTPTPAPAPAPVQSSLPEGWQEHFTADGRPYYYNPSTQLTTWERPAAAAAPVSLPPPVNLPPPVTFTPAVIPAVQETPVVAVSTPTKPPVPVRQTPPPASLHDSPSVPRAGPRVVKSVMLNPETVGQQLASLKHSEDGGAPVSPIVGLRKVPPNSSPKLPTQGSVGGGLDADELKQKLARRSMAPGSLTPQGGSPALSPNPRTLNPATTPSPSALSPAPVRAAPASEPSPAPSPAPSPSPAATKSPETVPPMALEKPTLGGPPQKAAPPVPAPRAAVHKRTPSNTPPTGAASASPAPTPAPIPAPITDSPATPAAELSTDARVEILEKKIAEMEKKQKETNDILANVLAQLQKLTA